MKIAAAAIVLFAGLFFVLHHGGDKSSALPGYNQAQYEPPSAEEQQVVAEQSKNDFMTARQFEKFLAHRLPYAVPKGACHRDRSGKWTYICTVDYSRWGYKLAGSVLLASRPLR
jgi:hypothetical protein